jgi:hypothetical protein
MRQRHDRRRDAPPAGRWVIGALAAVAMSVHVALAEQEPVSAAFMASAIAKTGWYELEECPPSAVEERSAPGCARIPTTIDTAVEWLDRIDETVFHETSREGEWEAERGLVYAVWRLLVTGQRYLLVLAPHPTRAVTILYVSELTAD